MTNLLLEKIKISRVNFLGVTNKKIISEATMILPSVLAVSCIYI